MDDAGIDGRASSRDGLKEELVARHLDQHEAAILIELRRRKIRSPYVALPQLAAGTRHEVRDALLRLDAFIDVVVTGEDHVDAVLDEQRLERHAQIDLGSVGLTV